MTTFADFVKSILIPLYIIDGVFIGIIIRRVISLIHNWYKSKHQHLTVDEITICKVDVAKPGEFTISGPEGYVQKIVCAPEDTLEIKLTNEQINKLWNKVQDRVWIVNDKTGQHFMSTGVKPDYPLRDRKDRK